MAYETRNDPDVDDHARRRIRKLAFTMSVEQIAAIMRLPAGTVLDVLRQPAPRPKWVK